MFRNQINQRLLLSNNKFKFQKIISANDNIDILISDVLNAWNELCLKKYDISYFNSNAQQLLDDNYIPTKIIEWKETFEYYNNLDSSYYYMNHNKKQTHRLKNIYISIRNEKNIIANALLHMTHFKTMSDNDTETKRLIDCVAVPIKYLIDWNHLLLFDPNLNKTILNMDGSLYIKLFNNLIKSISDSYMNLTYSTTTTYNTVSNDTMLLSRFFNRLNWTKRRTQLIKSTFNSLNQLSTWCLPEAFNYVRTSSKLPTDIFNIIISYFEYNII